MCESWGGEVELENGAVQVANSHWREKLWEGGPGKFVPHLRCMSRSLHPQVMKLTAWSQEKYYTRNCDWWNIGFAEFTLMFILIPNCYECRIYGENNSDPEIQDRLSFGHWWKLWQLVTWVCVSMYYSFHTVNPLPVTLAVGEEKQAALSARDSFAHRDFSDHLMILRLVDLLKLENCWSKQCLMCPRPSRDFTVC